MDSSLKFNSTDFTDQDIASLEDVPSAAGMTAAQLKARFDNIGKNMIAMGKHNALVDALSGENGASGIGALDYDEQGNVITVTVQESLDNLQGYINEDVLVKYEGDAPTSSVTELPDNCWWAVSGAVLAPLLGSGFTWTLGSATTYYLKVLRLTASFRRYELNSAAGAFGWAGGKRDSTTDIDWYTTRPDTALTVSGVPAESKAVGDIILGNVLVKYTGDAPSSSVMELPDNSWWVTSGAVISPLLGPNFTWTLSSGVSYVIKVYKLTTGFRRYELSSVGGSDYWTGGKTASGTEINWYTTVPDTTLTISGVPADSKAVGDIVLGNVLVKYTGDAPASSVAELPDNCWWAVSGAVLAPLLGPNFAWALNSETTYYLKVLRLTAAFRRYELSSAASSAYWTGGKRDSTTDIAWYTTQPDDTLSVSGVPADSKTVGDKFDKIDATFTGLFDDNAVEVYTDFEKTAGWWKADGTLGALSTQTHTQKLPIRGNTQYFVGHFAAGNSAYGAFFDKAGDYIVSLLPTDITQYSYPIPDASGNGLFTDYVAIYTFTSPANACYFSYNISEAATRKYRNYVASKPVFALTGSGNLQIKKDDPIYQKYKNRKLCVIGPSTVMIDRLSRTGNFDNSGNNLTQYIVGFQEYLVPWWSEVRSFGYSGAEWAHIDYESGGHIVKSIYTRVITDHLDLTGYDDFLLIASGNGLDDGRIGELTSYDDLGDDTKYMGGIRQVINYIYGQNPDAMIYVQTMRYQGHLGTTKRAVADELNEKLRSMSHMLSATVVDAAFNSGINPYNSARTCYDAESHNNQIGQQMQGLCARKAMLGF